MTHTIAIKGHWHTARALGIALLLALGSCFFSYTAHAATNDTEFVVTETISPILDHTSLVLTSVSETLRSTGRLTASTIEQIRAQIAELTAQLQALEASTEAAASPSTNAASSDSPKITSVKPGNAVEGKSVIFNIRGEDFKTGAVIQYTNQTTGKGGTIYPSYVQSTEILYALTPQNPGTYAVSVKNPNGEVSNAKTIAVIAAGTAPSVWLSPSLKQSIPFGGTVSFYWGVSPTRGTICKAAGNGVNGKTGSGSIDLSGSWTTPKLYADVTYGIKCTGPTGLETYKYIDIDVAKETQSTASGRPSISVTAASDDVEYGKTTKITWNVTPIAGTTCKAAGTGIYDTASGSSVPLEGTWETPKLYTDTSYGIRCTNDAGSKTEYIDISVDREETVYTAPSITRVDPGSVQAGNSTIFTIQGKNFSSGAVVYYKNESTGYSGTLTPSRITGSEVSVIVTPNAGSFSFYVQNTNGEKSNSGWVYVY